MEISQKMSDQVEFSGIRQKIVWTHVVRGHASHSVSSKIRHPATGGPGRFAILQSCAIVEFPPFTRPRIYVEFGLNNDWVPPKDGLRGPWARAGPPFSRSHGTWY